MVPAFAVLAVFMLGPSLYALYSAFTDMALTGVGAASPQWVGWQNFDDLFHDPEVVIVGCQPEEGSQIPGIRKWPVQYLPRIYDAKGVDRLELVSQADAEETARQLARVEGIFAGISSGGACAVALRISREVENATIVFIICDRGDRYLSTGVFPG